jgi:hypothetical protein
MTSSVATSSFFVTSEKRCENHEFGYSTIVPFSANPLTSYIVDSSVSLKASISSSALVRQAGGGSATRTTLLTVGSFTVLVIVGVVVVKAFRRQNNLITNDETEPGNAGNVRIGTAPQLGQGNAGAETRELETVDESSVNFLNDDENGSSDDENGSNDDENGSFPLLNDDEQAFPKRDHPYGDNKD